MNEMRYVPPPKRFVAFDDYRGVLLGVNRTRLVWSGDIPGISSDDPPGYDAMSAPTFTERAEVDRFLDHLKYEEDVPIYRLVEVVPDLPDNRASETACANRALPAWRRRK